MILASLLEESAEWRNYEPHKQEETVIKSLYGRYIEEREGLDIIEDDYGFATYQINSESGECYIIDIYVIPECRRGGKAAQYADEIAEIALENDCTHLTGSVDPRCFGANDSLKVLLAYGFKLVCVGNDGLIYFKKDL